MFVIENFMLSLQTNLKCNMKKLFLCFTMVIVLVALSSCNSSSKKEKEIFQSPEKVSTEFLTAFWTADFDNMEKYSLQSNHVIFEDVKKSQPKAKLDEMKNNKVEIVKVKCIMKEDSVAKCQCQFLVNSEQKGCVYDLRKHDGKWFVAINVN